jgi:hypothetical protein
MTTHNYRRQAFLEKPAIWKTIAATRAYILRAWGAAVLRPYMNGMDGSSVLGLNVEILRRLSGGSG